MQKVKYFFVSLLLLSTSSLSAHSIARLKEQILPEASVGFIARNADTGEILQTYHARQAFVPASSAKLLTAVAATRVLGANYTFETSLQALPESIKGSEITEDIYLVFTGDPSLSRFDIDDLFKQLKQKGIKTISGNIIIVANRFKEPWVADGIEVDDTVWGYAAPVSTAIIDRNAVNIVFGPSRNLGQKVNVKLEDAPAYITLNSYLKAVTLVEANNNCSIYAKNHGLNLSIYGCSAVSDKPEKARLAITDPNSYAQEVSLDAIKKAEIEWRGKISLGALPKNSQILVEHRSEALSKLIAHMLKESDNLYAGSLTKAMGWKIFKEGSFRKGAQVIRHVVAKEANVPANSIKLVEGSGLSQSIFITPWQLSNLLLAIYHDPELKKVVFEGLPQSGLTGTLKNRMQALQTKGHVIAKTGGMSHVSSLSGYIKRDKHPDIIFVMMENNVTSKISRARHFETRVLELLISNDFKNNHKRFDKKGKY